MTQQSRRMNLIRLWISLATGVGIGCLIVRALWLAWTPLCSETCPPRLALSLYAFIVTLPIMWGCVGAVVGSSSRTRGRKILAVSAVSAITMATVVGLTIALHVAPKVNSMSG
ncbi:hypothetical protein SAMN02787076_01171 [Rhizobacter sp. OV335]|nr:hypothetical protein SAMN02787076_01171 [Rhizobacter sp. OV335]